MNKNLQCLLSILSCIFFDYSFTVSDSDVQYIFTRSIERNDAVLLHNLLQSNDRENIEINKRDEQGNTPLIKTSKANQIVITEELVKAHADVTISDSNGWTALQYACFYGHIETVKILLTVDKLENYIDQYWTPLNMALLWKDYEMAELLGYKRQQEGLLTEENIQSIEHIRKMHKNRCELI